MGLAIIYLYDSTVTDFTYNGQPLNKAYEVVVDSMINDSFFVTFNHPLDDKGKYKTIEKDKIVKVHTPDGMQPFRIMDRVKYMDHISVEAWPLFYADMRNKLVKPLMIRGLTGQAAINMFVNNLLIDTPFTFTSNIIDTHDYHTQDAEERENNPNQLYNALDVFKAIVKRWQGELVINGYDIRVLDRLGTNTGALLYEKKNISDFTDEESIQDVTTRLYGKSEWTERPQGSDEEVKHEISVKVESPLINAYSGIVFEKQYTNNDIRTEKEMKDWLNLKFTTENIDKPSRNIKVGTNIVDDTVIDLGDSLVLKYVKHDVDMEIRMIGYTYDGYANRYITIQLGDAKQSYVGNVQNTVRDLETNVGSVVKQTVNQILNSNGERMIYSATEPVGNFKNGDVWFDQQGGMYFWDEARGMWIDHPYNRNMNLIADKIVNEIEPEISKMTASIAEADNNSKKALDKANVNTDLLGEHRNILASLNGQLAEDLVTDQTVTNPKTWLTNYGKLVANNGYDTTDYIPVNKDDLLSLESTVSHYYKLAFYDTGKNNLGYYDGSKVVLTPSGTAYFGNTGTFNAPADGFVRLSYSTATGGTDTVKLSNQNNLYTLINSGYNNALSALRNVDRAMQEFGENLISLDSLNNGYWLDAQGKLMSNNAYKTTDYIRVDAGERYKLIGGNAVYQVYFYDANREALSFYDGKEIKTDINNGFKYFTSTPNIEFNIPEDASYVRIASSIKDFSQVSFSKVSTMIANMLSEVDGVKKQVEDDLVDVRTKANEAFDKAKENDGKLATVEQTVDDLKGEISQKVSSAEVTESLNTFNESIKKQTSEQISSSLTGYAKSTDLEGYATEEYATNKAVSEAGKVSTELTKYELKTGVDSKVSSLATSLREETAEKMRTVYTKEETEKLLGDKADSSVLTKYVQQATYEAGIEGISSKLSEMSSKKLDFIAFEDFFDNEYKKTAQGVTDMYTKVNKIIDANGNATDTFAKAVYDRNAERQNNDFQKVTDGLVKTATYEEGIDGVEKSISSVQSSLGGMSQKINSVQSTADGNKTTIANVKKTADGAVQKTSTEYQTIKERSDLYERVIGKDENGVKGNISRIVQTSGVIQSEVASAVPNPNLLSGTDFKEGLGDVGVYTRTPTLSEASYFPYGKVATINTPETSGTANLGFTVRIPKKDTWYTLSFYGLTNWVGSNSVSFFSYYMKNSKNYKAPMIAGSPARHKIQITVQVTRDDALLYVRPQGNAFGAYSNIVFYGVKLELGEIATPWENSDPATSSQITQLSNSWALTLKSGNDVKTAINATNDGIRLKGDLINLDAKTTVAQEFWAKQVNAIKVNADNITTGQLDGSRIRANSIDTNRLTGNISEFIRTYWQQANGQHVRVDGTGMYTTGTGDWRRTYFTPTGMDLFNGQGSKAGAIGYFKANRDYVNGNYGDENIMWGDRQRHTIGVGVNYNHVLSLSYVSSSASIDNGYNDALTISPQDSGKVSIHTSLDMLSRPIENAYRLNFRHGGYIFGQQNSSMYYNASLRHDLAIAGSTKLAVDGTIRAYTGIDMNGNDIARVGKLSYNSDERLKTNIKQTAIKALEAIERWKLVEYYWRENGEHVEVGLIAQNTPELMTYDVESDIYGIDAGKQTMYNTLAIQQLNTKVDDKVAKLEHKIATLQDELALLKGA